MLRTLLFLLALTSFWLLTAGELMAEVAIVTEASPLTIKSNTYEARIEADGCLTNLRIHGREFLAPGVAISRGSYFYQNGPVKLPKIDRPSENVVVAKGDAASISYEFGESEMTWQLANESDDPLVFFIVFSKDVEAAFDQNGKAFVIPINEEWTEVALVAGNSKLKISGCDKLWGPWEGPHQVCQVSLAAREKKSLKLSVGDVSPAEREQISLLVPKPTPAKLQLYSPRNYQVFQRSSEKTGTFRVSGHTTTDAVEIRVRVTGKSIDGELDGKWQSIPIEKATRSFSAVVPLAAGGWYKLDVDAMKQDEVIADLKVERFGMGEVFVGSGQSNSTNCGEIRTQQQSGMVASFSGQEWQIADDPQLGVADKSQGGSFWPAFGDAMYERFKVPIGVATTGFGGTSVNQWQPDGDLFPWMMTRIHQLGPDGFRALLWHQGESDVAMPTDEYYAKLSNVIQKSQQQARWYFPWFVAQASYHNPEQPRFDTVRNAQQRLWKSGIALQGPDTDTLTGDRRDFGGAGIHFSPKGLYEHGRMWADLVGDYVEVATLGEVKTNSNDLKATASAWPDADAMFHRDPDWLGGDDAYSVDLGEGRVAWFFGDSFVAPTTPGQRRGTTMVRNSVGLQTGYDPTTAKFETFWREEDGKPKSFIADEGKEFFWPGGSLLVDGKLLMCMMRARDANRKLAFDVTGWGAVLIENLDASPGEWKVNKLTAPQNSFGVLIGSASLLRDGDHVIAFSVSSENHDVHLVRWQLKNALEGDLKKPEWWAGAEAGWVAQEELTLLPPPLFKGGQTEFTVHYSSALKCYVQFQFAGFPLSPIGFRTAPALTGPWSELKDFYEPKRIKSNDPEQMLYAAKAHPEQINDGLAMTYCSNTFRIESLFENLELYFPRFLRVKMQPSLKH